MRNKFFFLFQALIICYRYIFINALLGDNIRNATRREYPAVVCFANLDLNHSIVNNIFCTGVFITKSHILSSQHCFDHIGNRNFRIVAQNPDVYRGLQYFPWWWTTYDRWAQITNIPRTFDDNDIAMLRIRGHATMRMRPSPISTISPESLLVGSQVQVVGFGRTNTRPRAQILQTANVFVLSTRQCEAQLYEATGQPLRIYERYLCTADNAHVLLTEGDSGGPVYYQGYVVALNRATMSSLLPIDDPRRVNIHLGLEWYRNFINEHLQL